MKYNCPNCGEDGLQEVQIIHAVTGVLLKECYWCEKCECPQEEGQNEL